MEKFISIEGNARTNTKIVDKKNNIVTEINEPGSSVTKADLLKFYLLFDDLVKPEDIVVLSGSVCPGIPDEIYGELTERAKN